MSAYAVEWCYQEEPGAPSRTVVGIIYPDGSYEAGLHVLDRNEEPIYTVAKELAELAEWIAQTRYDRHLVGLLYTATKTTRDFYTAEAKGDV